jgi:uncharacterized membrane protein
MGREIPPSLIDTGHTTMRHIDLDYVSKAIVGIASPMVGLITSFQEQIEWHLRVASLLVGLAVGVMSLVAMVRKWRGR